MVRKCSPGPARKQPARAASSASAKMQRQNNAAGNDDDDDNDDNDDDDDTRHWDRRYRAYSPTLVTSRGAIATPPSSTSGARSSQRRTLVQQHEPPLRRSARLTSSTGPARGAPNSGTGIRTTKEPPPPPPPPPVSPTNTLRIAPHVNEPGHREDGAGARTPVAAGGRFHQSRPPPPSRLPTPSPECYSEVGADTVDLDSEDPPSFSARQKQKQKQKQKPTLPPAIPPPRALLLPSASAFEPGPSTSTSTSRTPGPPGTLVVGKSLRHHSSPRTSFAAAFSEQLRAIESHVSQAQGPLASLPLSSVRSRVSAAAASHQHQHQHQHQYQHQHHRRKVRDRLSELRHALRSCSHPGEELNISAAIRAYQDGRIRGDGRRWSLFWGGRVVGTAGSYAEFAAGRRERMRAYARDFGRGGWFWYECPLAAAGDDDGRSGACTGGGGNTRGGEAGQHEWDEDIAGVSPTTDLFESEKERGVGRLRDWDVSEPGGRNQRGGGRRGGAVGAAAASTSKSSPASGNDSISSSSSSSSSSRSTSIEVGKTKAKRAAAVRIHDGGDVNVWGFGEMWCTIGYQAREELVSGPGPAITDEPSGRRKRPACSSPAQATSPAGKRRMGAGGGRRPEPQPQSPGTETPPFPPGAMALPDVTPPPSPPPAQDREGGGGGASGAARSHYTPHPKIFFNTMLDTGANLPMLPTSDLDILGIDPARYAAQTILTVSGIAGSTDAVRVYDLEVGLYEESSCVEGSIPRPILPVREGDDDGDDGDDDDTGTTRTGSRSERGTGRAGGWQRPPRSHLIQPVMFMPEHPGTTAQHLGRPNSNRLSGIWPFLTHYVASAPGSKTVYLGADRLDVLGPLKMPALTRWNWDADVGSSAAAVGGGGGGGGGRRIGAGGTRGGETALDKKGRAELKLLEVGEDLERRDGSGGGEVLWEKSASIISAVGAGGGGGGGNVTTGLKKGSHVETAKTLVMRQEIVGVENREGWYIEDVQTSKGFAMLYLKDERGNVRAKWEVDPGKTGANGRLRATRAGSR
ncbi:hypothetical protein MKZ38_001747 [Zalerion maritima]|uniref:Peptidase A2 domain-containing protein n=1 Tax=Zalerion maritima TaxID=339359 RepID=A0AAD5WXE6_9PEZI|nr:hypothetical protein MKZ38_001747 [Zalerion maritima]